MDDFVPLERCFEVVDFERYVGQVLDRTRKRNTRGTSDTPSPERHILIRENLAEHGHEMFVLEVVLRLRATGAI
jgi:hypothetical protein